MCKIGVFKNFTKFTWKHPVCNFIETEKKLWNICFPVNFAKFCRTHFLIEQFHLITFEMTKNAPEKCFLPYIIKCFRLTLSYLKLVSPDHISSIYQLMLLIFKVSYHYHWSFQIFILTYGKANSSQQKISCETFLDTMIVAFLIVLPLFKKSWHDLFHWYLPQGKKNRT